MPGNKERQRRLARERYRRQQEERLARRRAVRKRTLTVTAALAAAGLVLGLVFSLLPSAAAKKNTAAASPSPHATSTTTATTVTEPAHHCTYTPVTTNVAKKVSLPPATPDYTANYTATLNTNVGPITIRLLNSKATCTVNSFVHLAETGYFNNTQCHRLVTSGIYVLQCGDPYAAAGKKLTCSSAPGSPGTGTPGYTYNDENLAGARYTAGVVAMANSGANTNGSQFFIVYKDTTGLAASYTPFGAVSSGLNIVQNVAKDGLSCQYGTGDGAPRQKVIINSVLIKKT